ncbi:MAG: CPBP family intramembrane metalloprotease [Propionibacteriaceae bacterium]|nr:CPBP family intramembrane metalloprotease [Propionibacteriaceae bacterium]
MAGGGVPPGKAWGSPGLTGPPPGAAYPSVLRGDSYAWWRSVLGVFLAPMIWLLLGGAVGSGVLLLGWRVAPRGLEQSDYFAAGQRFEFWEGMLASHVQIALLIPICFLMVRSWHMVRPGYLWSVEGRPRWGYLWACVGVAAVVFGIYIATMPLRGQAELVWQPQPGFWAFFIVILLTSPLQAAAEEFLFRGYLLQGLGSLVTNPWFGVVTSALVFALFHGTQNLPLFGSRFAFGVVVGWLVLRTGGLEAAIAAHVVNNVFAFTLAGLTSTIAESRTLTSVGWVQAFSDVVVYSIITLIAAGLAVRMKVRSRALGTDRGAAQ